MLIKKASCNTKNMRFTKNKQILINTNNQLLQTRA